MAGQVGSVGRRVSCEGAGFLGGSRSTGEESDSEPPNRSNQDTPANMSYPFHLMGPPYCRDGSLNETWPT